jgi:hypothetical protein
LTTTHSVAKDFEDDGSASLVEKLMYNDRDLTRTETDRLKLCLIEADQVAFIDVMTLF